MAVSMGTFNSVFRTELPLINSFLITNEKSRGQIRAVTKEDSQLKQKKKDRRN